MRVGILGPLEVVVDGGAVEIGGGRLRALLIRLALDAGRAVTVESLSSALWPDGGPANPAHALQSQVSRLRAVLPEAVRTVSGGYRLDVAPEAVDAVRFERLALQGRRALEGGQVELAARRLREALDVWRGEALADVAQARFAAAAVVRLDELRLAAIEDRVEAELGVGSDPGHLVAELEELTAAHPLRERLRGLHIRALHAEGRDAEALTVYERFRRLLADELGADPGQETRRAHLAVLRGETVPHGRRGIRPGGNLRAPLTSFVGRAEERERIGKQLRDERLVTLVGPGGAGKTRLATTIAADVDDQVPGGVWLVELAPVSDPGDVAQAVISVLGLRDAGLPDTVRPRDPVSRLVEALSATELLIVLDNCEHVVDAAARLVEELLGRCPSLRVLATSREPLAITGEVLCPVPPLGLPEPGTPAAEAVTRPAVRLFADRAAAAAPDFVVGAGNIDEIMEICRRLDGLPLAIELAAARLRTMSLTQLARRLDDGFQLLTGRRTAMPRHRTLHAVVAWSWDLLDEGERTAAERLAVFPSSFTPESAEWLGAPLDTVDALVDKSLLQLVEGAQPRYRMLETIREYALGRLTDTGALAAVRAAHAAHFLDLAERAEPQLRSRGQLRWLRALAAERDNLLAALHFACDAGDAGTALRLAAALAWFWTIQDDHAVTAQRLRLALDVPGDAPPAVRADAAAGYLFNAVSAGESTAAKAGAQRLRALARAPGSPRSAATMIEALLALITDDPSAGLSVLDEQLSHPDPWTRAMLWLVQSYLHGSYGDMGEMRRDLTAAVAGFRDAGDRWGTAISLTSLGLAHTIFGDFVDAVAALEESIDLVREFGTDGYQRVWLAMVRMHTGDLDTARAELLAVVTGAASASNIALARLSLGDLARYDGDLAEAARQLDLAAAMPGAFDHAMFRVLFGAGSGALALERGDLDAAEQSLGQALAMASQMPDMPMVAAVGVGVAQLRARHGAPGTAAEVLGAAHALRGAPDSANPDVARLAHDLRDSLGVLAYQAAYDRGRQLDRTNARALIEAQVRQARRR